LYVSDLKSRVYLKSKKQLDEMVITRKFYNTWTDIYNMEKNMASQLQTGTVFDISGKMGDIRNTS